MESIQNTSFGSDIVIGNAAFGAVPRPAGREEPVIRAVSPDTVPVEELASMYAACFSGEPWNEDWTQLLAGEVIESLMKRQSDFVLALSPDGELMGFSIGQPVSRAGAREEMAEFAIDGDEYYLAEVGVGENWRGQKLSEQMVAETVRLAELAGFSSILSRTREDNTAMIRTFERLGFQLIGDQIAESGGKESRRVVYRRLIGEMQS